MSWYHGTCEEEIRSGDLLDPSQSRRDEVACWATESREIAQRWADDLAAATGGTPVVYQLRLLEPAIEVDVIEDLDREIDGSDDLPPLVIERRGEDNVRNLWVLSDTAAVVDLPQH